MKNQKFKQFYLNNKEDNSPFDYVGGEYILNSPIKTRDFIDGQSGFKLDPKGFSKISAFGGNVTLYDAVVDASGKGQFKTIQDAINAGKKSIFVRKGSYDPIVITNSNTKIFGEYNGASDEDGGVTIKSNGASFDAIIDINSGLTNINIKDIYVDATYANNGIKDGNGTEAIFIEKCWIYNAIEAGIYLVGTNNAVISRTTVFNNYHEGIKCVNTFDLRILDSEVSSNKRDGLLMEYCRHSHILGNKFYNNGTETNNTYSNIFLDENAGNYTLNTIIANNIMFGGVGNQVKYGVRETSANIDYTNIIGNIIKDAVTANISLQGANSSETGNI